MTRSRIPAGRPPRGSDDRSPRKQQSAGTSPGVAKREPAPMAHSSRAIVTCRPVLAGDRLVANDSSGRGSGDEPVDRRPVAQPSFPDGAGIVPAALLQVVRGEKTLGSVAKPRSGWADRYVVLGTPRSAISPESRSPTTLLVCRLPATGGSGMWLCPGSRLRRPIGEPRVRHRDTARRVDFSAGARSGCRCRTGRQCPRVPVATTGGPAV